MNTERDVCIQSFNTHRSFLSTVKLDWGLETPAQCDKALVDIHIALSQDFRFLGYETHSTLMIMVALKGMKLIIYF